MTKDEKISKAAEAVRRDREQVLINGKTKYLVYGVYFDTPEEAQTYSALVRKQPVVISMDRDEILSLMQRVEYLESELARYKELYAIEMDIASTLPMDRL